MIANVRRRAASSEGERVNQPGYRRGSAQLLDGGVAGVDEVRAAEVAGEADVHAVHHVAEAELSVGIAPSDRAAGAEVAEAVRSTDRHQRRRKHEAETELDVEV